MSEETTHLPVPAEPSAPAVRDAQAGVAALAQMSEGEFRGRLAAMERGRDRLRQIHESLMTPEVDYGVIPGTNKPTLLKPGAEKLLHFYGLCCEFDPAVTYGDGEKTPWVTVVTECRLHVGDLSGPVINTGHGAANSWERKYRRQGDCMSAHDLLNTLVKMSDKRAMVDAALRATATSGVYGQDMEDLAPDPPPKGQRPASGPPVAPSGPPAPPVVCYMGDCGTVLSPDEIKASSAYAEAFGGEKFCKEHGRELVAIWKAKQATAQAVAE